jgi:hypothetical protein
MRFYEDHGGMWKDEDEDEILGQFWAWYKSHPRRRETSMGILWTAFLISYGDQWAWDPADSQRLYRRVLSRRAIEAAGEEPAECECGLGACQGHGGGE